MKQILLDYTEYEDMIKLINEQQKAIEEFKKGETVVLVDERFGARNPRLHWYNGFVPKIIAGAELAKEYLQNEFDNLSKQFVQLNESYQELLNKVNKEPKRKSFW